MSLRAFPLRFGRTAAGLALFMAIAAVSAYGSGVKSPQLGSISTVNLCVRRAGPEKGAVRFVERRAYCKASELRVRVLGEGSTQSALGIAGVGASAAPRPASGSEIRYLRTEAISPTASGTPETASATASCPAGTQVVSGGFRVDAGEPAVGNNPAEVVVTESRAVSDMSWTVTAFADDAEAVGPWSVAAYATCASLSG
jgi:hypothetical protein